MTTKKLAETPCFDKHEETDLLVLPTLSNFVKPSTSNEEVASDKLDQDSAVKATGSGTEESSSEDESEVSTAVADAPKVPRGGSQQKMIASTTRTTGEDDHADDEDDDKEEKEDDEDEEDEEDEEEDNEEDADKVIFHHSQMLKPMHDKNVNVNGSSDEDEEDEEDKEQDEEQDEEDHEEAGNKSKPNVKSKKTASRSSKTKTAKAGAKSRKSGSSSKGASKSAKVSAGNKTKVTKELVVAGKVDKNNAGAGMEPMPAAKKPSKRSAKGEGGGTKKKRTRELNMEETVENSAKKIKLECDIENMILSVKTKAAILEQAEKAFESASVEM